MSVMRESPRTQRTSSDILTLGFGTTVAMWSIGYVGRLPGVLAPSAVILVLLLACALAGGFLAGRFSDRGVRGGALAGALSGSLNLLVMGSLLGGERPSQIVPSFLIWIPGSIAIAAGLGALGAALAARSRGIPQGPAVAWTPLFVRVAVVATFFLLVVGGLVTSQEAGLAVVDWPNSFGYNMFLYPLSRMSGGIYFEHAHRLFGSLVGLTTLVLALHLVLNDGRRGVKALAIGSLGLVVVQGLLGGLRVTGRFTLSTDPTETTPNLALAVVHGVVGQVFFATLVALAVFTSTRFASASPPRVRPSARLDRGLSDLLVAAVLVQLVLGALLRHLAVGLLVHVTVGALVAALALALGVRTWSGNPDEPILRRAGAILATVTGLQLVLGTLALLGTAGDAAVGKPTPFGVLSATSHQGTGALVLAAAVVLALWSRRLLREG